MTNIELGNNESASVGIIAQADGTFLALTFTESKTFKTRSGAFRWLARRGFVKPLDVEWIAGVGFCGPDWIKAEAAEAAGRLHNEKGARFVIG